MLWTWSYSWRSNLTPFLTIRVCKLHYIVDQFYYSIETVTKDDIALTVNVGSPRGWITGFFYQNVETIFTRVAREDSVPDIETCAIDTNGAAATKIPFLFGRVSQKCTIRNDAVASVKEQGAAVQSCRVGFKNRTGNVNGSF